MAEVLTMTEIEARFPSEWVLIGEPQQDEAQQVLGGEVLHHSKDRDEVHRYALAMPMPGHIAIFFTGQPPPDVEFVL